MDGLSGLLSYMFLNFHHGWYRRFSLVILLDKSTHKPHPLADSCFWILPYAAIDVNLFRTTVDTPNYHCPMEHAKHPILGLHPHE